MKEIHHNKRSESNADIQWDFGISLTKAVKCYISICCSCFNYVLRQISGNLVLTLNNKVFGIYILIDSTRCYRSTAINIPHNILISQNNYTTFVPSLNIKCRGNSNPLLFVYSMKYNPSQNKLMRKWMSLISLVLLYWCWLRNGVKRISFVVLFRSCQLQTL